MKEIYLKIGEVLKANVYLDKVFFPKKPVNLIESGEFGILRVCIKEILSSSERADDYNEIGERFSENDYIIIKGEIPALTDWQNLYYFEGILEENINFGLQYKIQQFHKIYGLNTELEKRNFLTCLIGESKTDLLYSAYENPIELLQNEDRKALEKIKGIGKKTVELLINKYKANSEEALVAMKLQNYGLSLAMIENLRKQFSSIDIVLDILKRNPYSLIDLVDGIGWERADAIALNGGYNPHGEYRVQGYIKFFLKDQAYNMGHSWVDLDTLVIAIRNKITGIDDNLLREYLLKWIELPPEEAWLYYEKDTKRIGLSYYRRLEEKIAEELIRLKNGPVINFTQEEIEATIEEAQTLNGFEYTKEQKSAIEGCLNSNVYILSGSAGTGKTYSMRPIVMLLKKHGYNFAQCALSGKASSNLSEITDEEGYTIHRLLKYDVTTKSFRYNEKNLLPLNAIILDELSLVGGEIFLDLLKAIPIGCKLIMLGDPNQLEAIGLANLLKDCIGSGVIPYSRLHTIHRQAARSGIIIESLKASAGEHIVPLIPTNEVKGELQDLHLITYNDALLSQDKILEEFNRLYFNLGINIQDITIVVPMRNRGAISCLNLNNKIQSIVNGNPTLEDYVITSKEGDYILRPKDKILITQNHYDGVFTPNKEEVPIFNGNIGYITAIDIENEELWVNLTQQGLVCIPKNYWRDIELGYALTCHKMQGSSNNYIIVGIDMTAYTLLSKEWIYTALTRAKKYCTLVGQISAIRKSVKISRVIIKQTWLQEILYQLKNSF